MYLKRKMRKMSRALSLDKNEWYCANSTMAAWLWTEMRVVGRSVKASHVSIVEVCPHRRRSDA